jgi:hypothetical protein
MGSQKDEGGGDYHVRLGALGSGGGGGTVETTRGVLRWPGREAELRPESARDRAGGGAEQRR